MSVRFGVLSSLLSFVILVHFGGGLIPSANGQPTAGSQQPPGEGEPPAPDFTLQRMNGDTFQLSEHRGDIVVLNFWATWCPPCKKEIPGFITLQKEFGEQGVIIVGVSLDRDGFSSVRPYADKMDINYPLVVDDGSVSSKYGGVPVLPSTFVIGREGNVQYRKRGFFPERSLRTHLETLLEEDGLEDL